MYYNSFGGTNCVFSEFKKESTFDSVLEEKWVKAQQNGIFRYILNIQDSKILEGKYQFLIQVIFKNY